MSLISLTPDELRQRAQQYSAEADKVNQVIQTMGNLLNQLQNEWKGEASQAYAERYNELKPSFDKMEELIREISQALNTSADTYEQTDQNLASGFRGQWFSLNLSEQLKLQT